MEPALARRERKKLELGARIKDAARALFREKGYEAATTREIAARADVGIGTLFAYAPDKGQLLAMVFTDELDALTERSFGALDPSTNLLDDLVTVFRARYELWGADPELARHGVRETFASLYADDEAFKQAAPSAPQAALYRHLVALVRRHQEAGTIDRDEPASLVAELILDVYLSENRDWIAQPSPRVDEGVARLRRALALMLRAVAARSEGATVRAQSDDERFALFARLRDVTDTLPLEEVEEIVRFAEFRRAERARNA
jgi:AcrR family transcriptional regulator